MSGTLFIIQTTLPRSWEEFEIGSFSQLLIEAGAACVQRTQIHSMYSWADTLHSDSEWSLEIKVHSSKKDAVLLKIEELHPDETPQLLYWEVQASQGYADWAQMDRK
tara:strand:- start:1518 stop:1838 length:321 start_codon:yes stop_codon:yes gene_type:complete